MISLFRQETTKEVLIEDNGDYILDHICINAIITEELNGEYSLDADFRIIPSLNPEIYELLCEGSLLKADDEYGKEYFRIAKVIKTTKRITVFARHISISDTLTMFCEDVRPENQTGTGALRWIFDNANGVNWFNVSSDITVSNTAYYVNKNVYEALFTVDNCFLKRWGGEVYRRGFDIRINQLVGADRGVTIRSRKNLKGFEATTNIDYLKTRIYPKGYGGITIEEKYIDSPLINSYARVYSKEIKFEDVRVNDDTYKEGYPTLADAQKELKRRVNELYEIDKVDIIPANYRIDFVELGKTEEYKNYSILEKTWIGDTVEVVEDTLKINISVRVLKRQYDILKKKRFNTELSNKDVKEKPPTIKDIIDMVDRLPTAENMLQIARDEATALINAGINGYVVANKNEILIMDTEDKNTAVKVWRFNVNGLAFSPTGYYGTYETALTMDGKLVLNSVTCEGINALLINAGVLKSINNRTSFDLQTGKLQIRNDSGEVTFETDNTGNVSLRKITLIRPDGVKWVESGVAKFDFNAEACEPAATHQSIGIQQGFWLCYGAQTPGQYLACQYYTIKHTGRYLKVTVIRGLLNSNGWGNVRVRTPENNVLVSETFTNLVTDTNNYTTTLTVDLGAPTYTTRGFYIELAVSRADNNSYLRKLRMWQEG